jgi:hypothetical protein
MSSHFQTFFSGSEQQAFPNQYKAEKFPSKFYTHIVITLMVFITLIIILYLA